MSTLGFRFNYSTHVSDAKGVSRWAIQGIGHGLFLSKLDTLVGGTFALLLSFVYFGFRIRLHFTAGDRRYQTSVKLCVIAWSGLEIALEQGRAPISSGVRTMKITRLEQARSRDRDRGAQQSRTVFATQFMTLMSCIMRGSPVVYK